MNRLSVFFLLAILFSAQANALESSNTEIPAWIEEQAEIIAVSRFVALAPKERSISIKSTQLLNKQNCCHICERHLMNNTETILLFNVTSTLGHRLPLLQE